MKKLAAVFCLLGLLPSVWMVSAAAAPPEDIEARAALLVDAETGQVLYDKNGEESLEPASITKILTAMLALELLDPTEVLTASAEAAELPSWASSAGLQAGETLTLEQALYALMLPSGNDAAAVIAEAAAGSQQAFAQLMNERAASLGAAATHFVNPSGLPDPEHRTTARDMAIITRRALQTPGFLDVFGTAEYQMAATNLSDTRKWLNTHRMLRPDSPEYDPSIIGGKTGYTDSAGHTLVSAAQRAGRTLLCVILNSERYYQDTQELLDYGFTAFHPHTYAFKTENAQLPLMQGEQEAGFIRFRRPDPVSLLLPDSLAPEQITEQYLLPQDSQNLQASVSLLFPSENEEGSFLSLSLPLQAESAVLYPAAQQAAAPPAVQQAQTFPLWLLPAAAAGGLFAGVFLQRLYFARRGRRRTALRFRKSLRYSPPGNRPGTK